MNDVFSGELAVIGMGYIGLPTATVLATRGIHVTGVDINPRIVEAVSRGEVPFIEPDLAVAVSGAVAMGRLTMSKEVPDVDAYIIAVPTPFNPDHSADLSFVQAAAENIGPLGHRHPQVGVADGRDGEVWRQHQVTARRRLKEQPEVRLHGSGRASLRRHAAT